MYSIKYNNLLPIINEALIYEDLYKIFEEEFLGIENYIAMTDDNLDVYSNKIHELHLRVCSEVENSLKIVIHKNFIDEDNIKKEWESKKSRFLVKDNMDLTSKYKELQNELNSKGIKELDRNLFGIPDFLFYYQLACKEFNLHLKFIEFKRSITNEFSLKKFQPFKEDKVIPDWWTNYNGIKHNKANNYKKCTLKDLVHSLGALYILINY